MKRKAPKRREKAQALSSVQKASEDAVALQRRAHELKVKEADTHARADQVHAKVADLEGTAQDRGRRHPSRQPPPLGQLPASLKAAAARDVAKIKDGPAVREPQPALPFSVVGVGGSAGGFEAFVTFLRTLPDDTGMAFVLIQHLDPTHESKLSELLSKNTRLPLTEIKSGVRIEPNHIYVLGANASVMLSSGQLRLSPRYPPRNPMPIDVLFRSLAREQQNRAIGVVLSGTGSDGTLGLAEIKGMGGVTFAQDETSAKYYGMPGSAIGAGAVDFIFPPDHIAAEIARLAQHPYVAAEPARQPARRKPAPEITPAEDIFPEDAQDLGALFGLVRARTGVDFSLYKPATLNRRIMRRLALNRINSRAAYVRHLHEHPAEVDALFSDLLINVTAFFRDGGAFQILQKRILPRITKSRPADTPLRVWSCGCSTGEEAYSLAIAIAEFMEKHKRHFPVQIFASDLNERGLERARTGVFHENILMDVSPERLLRYFTKANGFYQVSKQIRDMCIFAKQNVVTDAPFSNLDLISCRNVLIYLTPILQKRILPIFHYALKPGGFLMLGNSETIGEFSDLFEVVDKKHKIYARKVSSHRSALDFESRAMPPPLPTATKPVALERVEPADLNLHGRVDRLILNEFSPPGVVINAQMDVLQFRGQTGPFLEHQPGAASLNLFKMARNDLAIDLRRVVTKAIRTGQREETDTELRIDGKSRRLRLEVLPIRVGREAESCFLVVFREGAALESPKSMPAKGRGGKLDGKRESEQVSKLREDLAATKESLQAIIEEQDATNEELKSANEEIQSTNEELQSTNEELETAREELQSTNEELNTLNQELQDRNHELGRLNNDLTNLLSSVNVAILMLGTDLAIRRFTPAAEKLFNLIPSDVGRGLGDLNRNIQIADLEDAIHEVIQNLAIVEREVQDRDGHWYSLKIRPYRTHDNKIDGVVLTLYDIDELKRIVAQAISLMRQPTLTLSGTLTIDAANDAFYHHFHLSPEQAERKSIYDLNRKNWNIPRLRHLLEELLPSQSEVRDFKVEHDFAEIGRRSLVINARRFYEEGRGIQLILVMIEDLTPQP